MTHTPSSTTTSRKAARDASIALFVTCSSCGFIGPLRRQAVRKRGVGGRPEHTCSTVEQDHRGLLCNRCGTWLGHRLSARCKPCLRLIDIEKTIHGIHTKRAIDGGGTAQRERITLARLIAEQGDVCYLCGTKVLTDVRYGHRLKATIDHVVPLSKGGDHTIDNCRVAHHSCNRSKGDRVVT